MTTTEIDRLKAANSIEEVAREYGITFNSSGRGRCAFPERHNNGDADPSLHLDRTQQRARCQSQDCFDGAVDVIGLVMKMEGIDFKAACQKLARRAGLGNGHLRVNGSSRRPSPIPTPAPMPPISEEIVTRLHAAMTPMAREYLRRERMLSPEIIDRYQLGIDAKNGERRVTIPIRDADGEIQDIRRWMPPESRKVGSRKMLAWEKGRGATRLFPMDQLEHDELVFGEGELDALAAISHNIPTITLTNGADTVPDEQQARLFAGKVVTVLLDHDEAGRKGVLKKSEALAPYAREVRIASWPEE